MTESPKNAGSETAPPVEPCALDRESDRLQAVLELWRQTGKRTEIPVVGGSMYPILRPGWRLVLDHASGRQRFGSIIVFRQGSLLVAHRVVGHRRQEGYRTKGDALLHFDRRLVEPDQVLGRVTAVRVNGREISLTGGFRSAASAGLAAYSRMVGELNRLARPMRRLTSHAGRLPGSLPGPTRVLGALNRVAMSLAARILSGSQRSASATSSPGGDTPAGGSL
jgi:hypothetical protein